MTDRKPTHPQSGTMPLTDALLRLGLRYGKGRDAALAGRLGPVERHGGRYFVRRDVIEALSASAGDLD